MARTRWAKRRPWLRGRAAGGGRRLGGSDARARCDRGGEAAAACSRRGVWGGACQRGSECASAG